MYHAFRLIAVTVYAVAVAVGVQTAKAELVQQDSSSFTYRYEMDVLPTANGDFTAGDGADGTVAGGILSMSTGYYHNAATWPGLFNTTDGWTVETRLQIVSSAGSRGAFNFVGGNGSTVKEADLGIGATGQNWDAWGSVAVGGTVDNTNGFHTFRVALLPGSDTYNIWRDGTLLNPTPLTNAGFNDVNMYFGDSGGSFAGSWKMDYVRYTAGAFAPVVPEPSSLVLVISGLVGLLVYAWRKRR
jgi:hypothetical protein